MANRNAISVDFSSLLLLVLLMSFTLAIAEYTADLNQDWENFKVLLIHPEKTNKLFT